VLTISAPYVLFQQCLQEPYVLFPQCLELEPYSFNLCFNGLVAQLERALAPQPEQHTKAHHNKQPVSPPLKQRLIPSLFSLSPASPLSPSPTPYLSLSIAQCPACAHPPSPPVETRQPSSGKYTRPTFYENFLSNPSLIDILLCKFEI
jgi:hypothetical protein